MSQEIGVLSLQSGFVIAAIIAAVLVANRIGGDGALAQRVTQVAIGLALVLLIFSATAAFRGPPSAPSQDLFGVEVGSEDELEAAQEEFAAFAQESAERNSEVGTVLQVWGLSSWPREWLSFAAFEPSLLAFCWEVCFFCCLEPQRVAGSPTC